MLRRIAFGIVLVFLAVAGMLFTALNQQLFDVDVAFTTFEVSSGLALLITFCAGLLAGSFARSRWVAQLLAERGRLRHALRLAEGRLGGNKGDSATVVTAPTAPTAQMTPTPPITSSPQATPITGTTPTTETPTTETTTAETTPSAATTPAAIGPAATTPALSR